MFFLKKTENKRKRGREWPIFKEKKTVSKRARDEYLTIAVCGLRYLTTYLLTYLPTRLGKFLYNFLATDCVTNVAKIFF